MVFLNPVALWGLLAVAIPIILHFFNLQRPQTILFSNISFIKEVKQTVLRRLKLRQLLLLLSRILLIACLVIAFARPVIVEETRSSLSGNRSVVILVDNSYSMKAGNENGPYFQQALSLSRDIIDAYDRQDEFLVMTTSDPKLNFNFDEQETVKEELKNFTVSQNTRSLSSISAITDDVFSRSSNPNRQLYLISDFQSSTLFADSSMTDLWQDSLTQVKLLPIATRKPNNVYIDQHRINSQIIEKGKPVELFMKLVNDGEADRKDLYINVVVNGKVSARDNVNLQAGTEWENTLTLTPTQSGWQSGYIEIDDYPINFDNKRYFSFYVPEKEDILVIEDEPSPAIRILYENLFEQFSPTFITSRQTGSVDLNVYKSVILVGMRSLSSGFSERLVSFIKQGGSMMFIPGPDLQIDAVNPLFETLSIGKFDRLISVSEGQVAEYVDLEHPIFEGVFTEEDSRQFDGPVVYKYYPFTSLKGSVQTKIMGLNRLQPILLEAKADNGLCFIFSTFPEQEWTDLSVKTIFAPIIFRATQLMNQSQAVQYNQLIGAYQPKIVQTTLRENISLQLEDDPESSPIIVEQYIQKNGTLLTFDALDLAEGNYLLSQGDKLLEKISFNISDEESQMDYKSSSELATLFSEQTVSSVEVMKARSSEIIDRVAQEKEGVPLWRYFIWGAVAFLLIEGLLAKFTDKQKIAVN
ncbi:MAG: BatA and WFA domain-containing protein [Bacteroidota bacterium]